MQNPAAHGFEKRHKLFKVFRSQPTRIEMFPVAARWHPPETRQSTAAPPRSMTMAPRRLTSASSVVDISIQILSVFSSGTISSITAADASGDGKQGDGHVAVPHHSRRSVSPRCAKRSRLRDLRSDHGSIKSISLRNSEPDSLPPTFPDPMNPIFIFYAIKNHREIKPPNAL